MEYQQRQIRAVLDLSADARKRDFSSGAFHGVGKLSFCLRVILFNPALYSTIGHLLFLVSFLYRLILSTFISSGASIT